MVNHHVSRPPVGNILILLNFFTRQVGHWTSRFDLEHTGFVWFLCCWIPCWETSPYHTYCWSCRNPASTSWGNGSSSHYLQGFIHPVCTINSITLMEEEIWIFPAAFQGDIWSFPGGYMIMCLKMKPIFHPQKKQTSWEIAQIYRYIDVVFFGGENWDPGWSLKVKWECFLLQNKESAEGENESQKKTLFIHPYMGVS